MKSTASAACGCLLAGGLAVSASPLAAAATRAASRPRLCATRPYPASSSAARASAAAPATSSRDDGCCNLPDGKPEQQSHGLVLHLDFRTHRADVVRAYYHDPGLYSASQGNLQALRNGDEFVGWGQNEYYSEYRFGGNSLGRGRRNLVYDAEMPGSNISYRVFRNAWIGIPYYPPSAAARVSRRGVVVYASWNGSTQTRGWQVLAGPRGHVVHVAVRYAARTGFETAIRLHTRWRYFRVRAIGRPGRILRTSPVVALKKQAATPGRGAADGVSGAVGAEVQWWRVAGVRRGCRLGGRTVGPAGEQAGA